MLYGPQNLRCLLAAMSIAGATTSAWADEPPAPDATASPWSATAGVATRYVSRGLDLTNGPLAPAVSAEYRFASGWYVNADSVQINYFGNHLEADFNAGYRGHRGALQYDLGAYEYYFPGTVGEKVRTREVGLRVSWNAHPVVPVLEVYHSPNYFFGSGPSLYADAGVDMPITQGWSLSARYGYSHVQNLIAFAYPNYRNWVVTTTHSVGRWDWALQFTDTSMNRTACLDDNRCSLKFTLRITRNFGS